MMRPSISLQAFHERRKHQLCVNHVTRIFAGGTRALDDISLSLTTGLNCLIGPKGAGKSTLLNVIGGREQPDRGTVSFGVGERNDSPALLRSRAAYLAADTRIPPPVPVHVALEHFAALQEPGVPQLRQARVEALLRQFDLWPARKLRVGELTSAMRWRLQVAIALLRAPRLVLVDVPTREVDDGELCALMDVLEVIAEERIVMVATSNAHVLQHRCAHVAILNRGRIVREGAADRLIDDFRGRVWEATVPRETARGMAHRHCLLSTKHSGDDHTTVVVIADEQPESSFVPVEPDLSHVYQFDLAAAG